MSWPWSISFPVLFFVPFSFLLLFPATTTKHTRDGRRSLICVPVRIYSKFDWFFAFCFARRMTIKCGYSCVLACVAFLGSFGLLWSLEKSPTQSKLHQAHSLEFSSYPIDKTAKMWSKETTWRWFSLFFCCCLSGRAHRRHLELCLLLIVDSASFLLLLVRFCLFFVF